MRDDSSNFCPARLGSEGKWRALLSSLSCEYASVKGSFSTHVERDTYEDEDVLTEVK